MVGLMESQLTEEQKKKVEKVRRKYLRKGILLGAGHGLLLVFLNVTWAFANQATFKSFGFQLVGAVVASVLVIRQMAPQIEKNNQDIEKEIKEIFSEKTEYL
jgi:hypothetical protein